MRLESGPLRLESVRGSRHCRLAGVAFHWPDLHLLPGRVIVTVGASSTSRCSSWGRPESASSDSRLRSGRPSRARFAEGAPATAIVLDQAAMIGRVSERTCRPALGSARLMGVQPCNFRPPRRLSAGWHGRQRHGQQVACTPCQLRPMVAAVKPTADTTGLRAP
jgi:hypothetical protein